MRSFIITAATCFSLFTMPAYADYMTQSGFIVKRVNSSSSHGIQKDEVEYYGYNWSQFFTAVSNAAARIQSGPHNYSISAFQQSDSAIPFVENNIDEIYFGPLPSTVFASTTHYWKEERNAFKQLVGVKISSADIILNNTPGFFDINSSTAWELTGKSKASLEETLIHELGHAIGLSHTSVVRDNMGGPGCGMYANGKSGKAYMGERMNWYLQSLYGVWNGGYADFGISAYNRTGSYTTEGQKPYARCGFTDDVGGPPAEFISNASYHKGWIRSPTHPVWALQVMPGDLVRVRFTIESTKNATQLPLKLYFSSNDVISTTDVELYSTSLTTAANDVPYVFEVYVTIPYSATGGFTALGAILDPTNIVSEWSKNNNIAYFPIYVIR
jgi:hypothetical protein